MAVLVDRFLRGKQWPSSKFVMWFRVDVSQSSTLEAICLFVSPSAGLPILLQKVRVPTSRRRVNRDIIGKLSDGTKFYLYRFLLYSDDFGPRSTLFPRGSVGGVYLKPIDVPVRMLRSPRSVSPVSLAPTGVNSNVLINETLKDIVEGSLKGVPSIDANGEHCRIFPQLIGYIGDYPESSDVCDVMKHSARSPCTLCNFRYRRTESGPTYCFNKHSMSTNSSFTRGWFRTKSVRYSALSKDQYKWLGMNDGSIGEMLSDPGAPWVLLSLASSFDKLRETDQSAPLTDSDVPVLDLRFDPYAQNLVAPDHCICGIIKSILKVCFEILPREKKAVLDQLLTLTLNKHGKSAQGSIYNITTKTLNGLSMSSLFACMAILPHALTSSGLSKDVTCFDAVSKFSKLANTLYWWPMKRTSTTSDFRYVHTSADYYEDLTKLLFSFIDSLETFRETDADRASVIDTPNIHRLIELVVNTVPTYGHCLLFAEMTFEAYHQKLKCNLSKNTTPKAHITAMRCALFIDWLHRLATEMDKSNDHPSKDESITAIAKVLLPHGTFLFNKSVTDSSVVDFRCSISDHLSREIDGVVYNYLVNNYAESITSRTACDEVEWIVTSTLSPIQDPRFRAALQLIGERGLEILKDIHTSAMEREGSSSNNFEQITSIQLVRTRTGIGSRTGKKVNTRSQMQFNVEIGDIVRLVCRDGSAEHFFVDTLDTNSKSSCQHVSQLYMVAALFRVKGEGFWASGSRLIPQDENCHYSIHLCRRKTQVFQITETMSPCAHLHNCAKDGECGVSSRKNMVVHKINFAKPLHVVALGDQDGFPFRSA